MAHAQRIRVVTYNIRQARGWDGATRPDRIITVLQEVDADIIALQEVLFSQALLIQKTLGLGGIAFNSTRRLRRDLYGNVCLSRLPLTDHASYDLTCKTRMPRGCLRADVGHGAASLHVFNVHLGLGYRERIQQVRMLKEILDPRVITGPRLLLGDFNEWFNGAASRLLRKEFGDPCGRRRSLRTHPSPLPVFPLDRIYHDPAVTLDRVAVHRSRVARAASDHLPTYADLRLNLS
ncbi:MAG TPA: endonuclease/exonuclease/phosphatase family protein [Nitrospirales bacterium]